MPPVLIERRVITAMPVIPVLAVQVITAMVPLVPPGERVVMVNM
jgi:hypothetical protein